MIIDRPRAESLARLLHEGRLILFAGAGVSRHAIHKKNPAKKLPLWRELAENVSDQFRLVANDYDDLLAMFEAISHDFSRADLEQAIRAAIPEDEFEPGGLHKAIADLPWQRIYTTNYDDVLQRALGEQYPVVSERDFERFTLSPEKQPKLIHLHGTLADPHTLTATDYQQWNEKHPRALQKIEMDGVEKRLLFMGYSNSDPHFKYRIMPFIEQLKGGRGQKNFSWMWKPSAAMVQLKAISEKTETLPIETDDEWLANIEAIAAAYKSIQRGRIKGSKTSAPPNALKRNDAFINGYKLFYYRDFKSIPRARLSAATGIPVNRLRSLETVNQSAPLGQGCFRTCSYEEIRKLERVLQPETFLEYGKTDDFLAYYIEYYANNWQKPRAKKTPQQQQQSLFSGRTKAVVFDFGGTLTIPKHRENTWERIWKSVGYSTDDITELHHLFSAGTIKHQEWCDRTCEKLRAAGFTRAIFDTIYADIEPVSGLLETFKRLREKHIHIHIVSGSLRTIIENVLDGAARYVDSIRSNDFQFDKKGLLCKIVGHDYDFQGKAKFIENVAADLKCHPIDILFVGNSLNDEKAALSGARTLCVNPRHTHPFVASMWNNTIREMTDLKEILRFV
jgi:phosphoserine phosphatase/NAD-dependent SIR2 family protein deacetylase